ncbi:MAG: septal ring lytic transglycosylase RlpA family protein [Pseudomonadota bacterium]
MKGLRHWKGADRGVRRFTERHCAHSCHRKPSWLNRRASWLIAGAVVLGLGGCSTPDGPPLIEPLFDPPDAVPRVEAKSARGNPPSYVVFGKRYYTQSSSVGYRQRGVASWYGRKFHGRDTSSGERFDMLKMTAAHRSLPLPTYVRVTHVRTGKSIVVRVNDRGPFHDDRIIDLSYAAAKKLGILSQGTGVVDVEAIDPSAPVRDVASERSAPIIQTVEPTPGNRAGSQAATASGEASRAPRMSAATVANDAAGTGAVATATPRALFLQAGAFASRANAEAFSDFFRYPARVPVSIAEREQGGQVLYRVRLGPIGSLEEADRLVTELNAQGLSGPFVLTE